MLQSRPMTMMAPRTSPVCDIDHRGFTLGARAVAGSMYRRHRSGVSRTVAIASGWGTLGCSLSQMARAAGASVCKGSRAMERRRLDTLLAERGLFTSRSRAAASVMAGEVRLGRGERRAAKPGELVDVEELVSSPQRPRSSRAAGSSWPTRSTRAGSRSRAGARSTSAPRRAASPTACCSAAHAR